LPGYEVCQNLTQIAGPTLNLTRLTYAAYSDGISTPAGANRKSPRAISNTVCTQNVSIPNSKNATDWFWLWGQWADHELSLSQTNSTEPFRIPVSTTDTEMNPSGKPNVTLPFSRSNCAAHTGTSVANCRQQFSVNTPLIDASQVYASEPHRLACLRAWDNNGTLLTSAGNMLPHDRSQLPQTQDPDDRPLGALFVAGDVRVNEHSGLMALHTLMIREHNRLANAIHADYPELDGDTVFSKARALLVAENQRITYEEYLPLLLGADALPPYQGYNSSTSPLVAMEFSSVCFRLGHTLLSPSVRLVNLHGKLIENVTLQSTFFNISLVIQLGIDVLLQGFATQACQELDSFVVDAVRNFLFNVTSGGMDLIAVNTQRGRDHGIPSYNQVRVALGLQRKANFSQISSNPEVVRRLELAYDTVDDIDMFIGALSEDHYRDAMVGELIFTVVVNQFTRARDADPNFYIGNTTIQADLQTYGLITLSEIIKANTAITLIQDNVFVLP